ncbi:tRNA (adenosine(37)-N6)-threonylcarbamoyltransferase complex dimerization subunit type 1 TsaB [Rhodobacter capsulatus]|uniref:tRNA (adenosine(37)-N6)-threonylcarbamoyltransferase complex dimerization subunit type 1 TsaB n=1 Tax=Rhodobacter capsulatus TaxID=1061 RepID=UPI004038A17F
MRSEPLVLGFDTSAAHCAAALVRGGTVLATRAEDMAKGQAERLMPLLEELLAEAGLGWHDLDALGVGTGPGNFTGVRISVAAARGLALGLGIPAVGVSVFEALAQDAPPPGRGGARCAARRGLCAALPRDGRRGPDPDPRRRSGAGSGRDPGDRPGPAQFGAACPPAIRWPWRWRW